METYRHPAEDHRLASTGMCLSSRMDFKEVVRKRQMVRSFADETIDPNVVERILDTARRGPSAGFSQGVEFVVIFDSSIRQKIAAPAQEFVDISGHHNFVAQAPVHVVVCVSPEVYRSRYREPDKMQVRGHLDDDVLWAVPYWYTDAGAAVQLLLMAAVNEGVAAAFVGSDTDMLRGLLGIPEDYIPVGIALLGHAAPDASDFGDVGAQPRPRRPYSEVVHQERW
jgi:nitroreductase